MSRSVEDELRLFFASDPAYIADPYPLYRRMREAAPVVSLGYVDVVTRHADVKSGLVDTRLSTHLGGSRHEEALRELSADDVTRFREIDDFNNSMLTHIDGRAHARIRGLMREAFSPRGMSRLRSQVETTADELFGAIDPTVEGDFIAQVAGPLPFMVLNQMLGIPRADWGRMRGWADAEELYMESYTGAKIDLAYCHDAIMNWRAYIQGLVQQRRREPTPDMFSALVAAEDGGDRLSEDELFAQIALLLVAGVETSAHSLGNALRAASMNPEQWQIMCDEPAMIPRALEELLRFDSPVHFAPRTAQEDVDFDGHVVPAGQSVLLGLALANHDPAVYERPDVLDVRRSEPILAFGFGPHLCLGAGLARLESDVVFSRLASDFPALRIVPERTRWRPSALLRGLESLPVVLSPS